MKYNTLKYNDDSMSISISDYNLEERSLWKKEIYHSISKRIIEEAIYFFTLQPYKNSLGFDYENSKKLWFSKKPYLVNFIQKVQEEQWQDIFESEEFERGLLRVVITDSEEILDCVDAMFNQKLDEFPFQLFFFEDDGDSFHYFNFDDLNQELYL